MEAIQKQTLEDFFEAEAGSRWDTAFRYQELVVACEAAVEEAEYDPDVPKGVVECMKTILAHRFRV